MNDPIVKVSAVIIRDKKLLLVSGHESSFYWSPGGKLEPGESLDAALKREIKEELNLDITKYSLYFSYVSNKEEDGTVREVHCYLVEDAESPECSNEIQDLVWVSRKDIADNKIGLASGVKLHLIPQLLKDSLL